MRLSNIFFLLVSALTFGAEQGRSPVLKDINIISRYWGNLSPYKDNPDNDFGIKHTSIPSGCQLESVQILQRHGERLSTDGILDGINNERFSTKISEFKYKVWWRLNYGSFSGPIEFLNKWQPIVDKSGLLTGIGAVTMFKAGVSFWNQYGRFLYNTSAGQVTYDPKFSNGTDRPPVILRTTSQSRMHNSQINWANGFFGSTFQPVPNPNLENVNAPYQVVVIPEGRQGKQNNTLAAYESCSNSEKQSKEFENWLLATFIPGYVGSAIERLKAFTPAEFTLDPNDIFAMQSMCAYEFALIGNSNFCYLFTQDEWAGFERALDLKYFYNSYYGSPNARAKGIGYVQELLARLNHSLITNSSSSVNLTLDSSEATFPTNQALYADFGHDDSILTALAAMSLLPLHTAPNLTKTYGREFVASRIMPLGGNLVTETIACRSGHPNERDFRGEVQYGPEFMSELAPEPSHKFIRMRLNKAILPLHWILKGECVYYGLDRDDGLCPLSDFVTSQRKSIELANYQHICFANDTSDKLSTRGKDWDGTILP